MKAPSSALPETPPPLAGQVPPEANDLLPIINREGLAQLRGVVYGTLDFIRQAYRLTPEDTQWFLEYLKRYLGLKTFTGRLLQGQAEELYPVYALQRAFRLLWVRRESVGKILALEHPPTKA